MYKLGKNGRFTETKAAKAKPDSSTKALDAKIIELTAALEALREKLPLT